MSKKISKDIMEYEATSRGYSSRVTTEDIRDLYNGKPRGYYRQLENWGK